MCFSSVSSTKEQILLHRHWYVLEPENWSCLFFSLCSLCFPFLPYLSWHSQTWDINMQWLHGPGVGWQQDGSGRLLGMLPVLFPCTLALRETRGQLQELQLLTSCRSHFLILYNPSVVPGNAWPAVWITFLTLKTIRELFFSQGPLKCSILPMLFFYY